tara:strand:- start:1110 stop:2144 length:1035 start_codon:yes stop_codon:yes gene_type:complete
VSKILIIGNMGYVGSELVKYFSKRNISVDGLDTGFFSSNINSTVSPEVILNKQIFKDVRSVNADDISNYRTIIYLAAISNDPMGQKFKNQTIDINYKSAIRIAKISKKVKVKKFIFASSCSVYGDSASEIKSELSDLNPLTTYAESKALGEKGLLRLADKNFTVTSLRFATACGVSDRMRLDLVVNDFTANSILNNKIMLLSKGNAYRPFISVFDMCRAFDWAVKRNSTNGGTFCTVNVGNKNLNMKVITLAKAVSSITNSRIIISSSAQVDKRSYRVSYDKYYSLAKNNLPRDGMKSIINKLLKLFNEKNILDPNFRDSDMIRLKHLNRLIKSKKINQNLFWI